jgi:coenzyme F420 hydrogenase subunit delta
MSEKTLVLGCGNILFGDDGFGPAVADYLLSDLNVPEDVAVLNLGLNTRGFIFNILLAENKPERIIIVDAVLSNGKKPGEIYEVPLDNLIKEKVDDFSFHQGPTSNMLKELRDLCGIEVIIIACQPTCVPEEMTRGLSEPVRKAVPTAGGLIYDRYLNQRRKACGKGDAPG